MVGASAAASLQRTAPLDGSTQSHTHAGLFRLLPYETTGAPIDGRTDRYWSGDFLRFTDPYAEIADWTFTLRSGAPAAELVVASYWADERPSFLAIVEGGPAVLAATDWRGVHQVSLPSAPRRGGPRRGDAEGRPPPGGVTRSGGARPARSTASGPCGWQSSRPAPSPPA